MTNSGEIMKRKKYELVGLLALGVFFSSAAGSNAQVFSSGQPPVIHGEIELTGPIWGERILPSSDGTPLNEGVAVPSTYLPGTQLPLGSSPMIQGMQSPYSVVGPDGTYELPSSSYPVTGQGTSYLESASPGTPASNFDVNGVYDGTRSFPMGSLPTQPFGERIISEVPAGESSTTGVSEESQVIVGTLEGDSGTSGDVEPPQPESVPLVSGGSESQPADAMAGGSGEVPAAEGDAATEAGSASEGTVDGSSVVSSESETTQEDALADLAPASDSSDANNSDGVEAPVMPGTVLEDGAIVIDADPIANAVIPSAGSVVPNGSETVSENAADLPAEINPAENGSAAAEEANGEGSNVAVEDSNGIIQPPAVADSEIIDSDVTNSNEGNKATSAPKMEASDDGEIADVLPDDGPDSLDASNGNGVAGTRGVADADEPMPADDLASTNGANTPGTETAPADDAQAIEEPDAVTATPDSSRENSRKRARSRRNRNRTNQSDVGNSQKEDSASTDVATSDKNTDSGNADAGDGSKTPAADSSKSKQDKKAARSKSKAAEGAVDTAKEAVEEASASAAPGSDASGSEVPGSEATAKLQKEVKSVNSRLERMTKRYRESQKQKQALDKRLAEANKEVKTLTAELKSLRARQAEMKTDFEGKVKSLEKDLSKSKQQAEERVADLQKQLQDLEQEQQRLQKLSDARLEEALKKSDAKADLAEQKAVQAAIASLEQQTSQKMSLMQREKAQLSRTMQETFEKQLSSRDAAARKMKQQLAQSSKSLEALQEKLSASKDEVGKLTDEMAAAKAKAKTQLETARREASRFEKAARKAAG